MSHADQATATLASAQQSGGGASSGSSGSSGGAGGAGGAAAQAAEAAELKALAPLLKHLNHVTIAHGTIMCLAFVIFFPAGSFVIRLGHFKGVVYVHAAIQMFAYMMSLAGMGMGVYLANAPKKFGRHTQVCTPRSSRSTRESMEADPLRPVRQIPSHHRPYYHLCPPLPARTGRPSPRRLRSRTTEIYLVYFTRLVGPRCPDSCHHPRRLRLTFCQQHNGRQDSVWCYCWLDLGQLARCRGMA